MRVAQVDAHGEILNTYAALHPVDGAEPDRPWAIYLADAGRYQLIAFDLDAKMPAAARQAAADADTLAGCLADEGMPAVVCESGPSGGRHVWTALAESVDAETVATLARLARYVCPTLDLAPLTNPVTGCVRPPGAPHRAGGRSTVLSGDIAALTAPTSTAAQVRRLVEHLALRVNATHSPTTRVDAHDRRATDTDARPWIPGPRRPLSAAAAAALHGTADTGDASAVLWTALIGAAAAHWRYADIAALAETAPGLEHARTIRGFHRRVPRDPISRDRLLRRQWAKAVAHVATTPRRPGADDPTFDRRADAIATHVREVQAAADAAGGRWTTRGGPADRRILDVLCALALEALSGTVEADVRRLALRAGIGRETARTALLRLSRDNWITQVVAAEGPHAAHWQITTRAAIHSVPLTDRSQAVPRPAGAGTAERALLLTELTQREAGSRHDTFTCAGLGHHAGNIYARTTAYPQTSSDLARATGDSPDALHRSLTRLQDAGLVTRCGDKWSRVAGDPRPVAAVRLGVAGQLAAREARYGVERALWAWWLAELAWMTSPGRHARRPRASIAQAMLPLEHVWEAHPPMPRQDGRRGRVVWADARAMLAGHAPRPRPQIVATDDRALSMLHDVLGAELIA